MGPVLFTLWETDAEARPAARPTARPPVRPEAQPAPGTTYTAEPFPTLVTPQASWWDPFRFFSSTPPLPPSVPRDLLLLDPYARQRIELLEYPHQAHMASKLYPRLYQAQIDLGEIQEIVGEAAWEKSQFLKDLPPFAQLTFPEAVYLEGVDLFRQNSSLSSRWEGEEKRSLRWICLVHAMESYLRWRLEGYELALYTEERGGEPATALAQQRLAYTLGHYQDEYQRHGEVIKIPGAEGVSLEGLMYGDLNDRTRRWEEARKEFELSRKAAYLWEQIKMREALGVDASGLKIELEALTEDIDATRAAALNRGMPPARASKEGDKGGEVAWAGPDGQPFNKDRFTHPELGELLTDILMDPAEVAPDVLIEAELARQVHVLAQRLSDQLAESWLRNNRPLTPPERKEVFNALYASLSGVVRVDPHFMVRIGAISPTYESFPYNVILASYPRHTTSPLDNALTYLHALLIFDARWGESYEAGRKMVRHLESGGEAIPQAGRRPLVVEGRELPGFFALDVPGELSNIMGINTSLWWEGEHFVEGEPREGPVQLMTVGYQWTPNGYIIVKVQGEPGLAEIYVPREGGGKNQNLLDYVNTQLEGDFRRGFTRYVVENLQQASPGRPVFFRRGRYTYSLDRDVEQEPLPSIFYPNAAPLPARVHPLPPMLQEAHFFMSPLDVILAMYGRMGELDEEIPYRRRESDDSMRDYAAEDAARKIALLKRAFDTWKGLDQIADDLEFKLEDNESSVLVLRPTRETEE